MLEEFLPKQLVEKLDTWQDQTKESFYNLFQDMSKINDEFDDVVCSLEDEVMDWNDNCPYQKYNGDE